MNNVRVSVRFVFPHRLICKGARKGAKSGDVGDTGDKGDIIEKVVSKVKIPAENLSSQERGVDFRTDFAETG